MNYSKYIKKAKETGQSQMIFRSINNDSNNLGKLVLIYLKFYPDGSIMRYKFSNLDNPFEVVDHIEICGFSSSILRLRRHCVGDTFSIRGGLSKKQIRQPDPVEKKISVKDISNRFGDLLSVTDENGYELLKIKGGKIFVNKEALSDEK